MSAANRRSPRRPLTRTLGVALTLSIAAGISALPVQAAPLVPEPEAAELTPAAQNRPPVVTCPSMMLLVGETDTGILEATDPDSDDVTFTLGPSTTGVQVSLSGHTVTYTAVQAAVGTSYVPVTAKDSHGATAACEISVVVTEGGSPTPDPSEPADPSPSPGEPSPTDPTAPPMDPPAPDPSQPAPTDPAPTPTAPQDPTPSDPGSSSPAPSGPGSSDPAPSTQPTAAPADPAPADPSGSRSPGPAEPTDPAPSTPAPQGPSAPSSSAHTGRTPYVDPPVTGLSGHAVYTAETWASLRRTGAVPQDTRALLGHHTQRTHAHGQDLRGSDPTELLFAGQLATSGEEHLVAEDPVTPQQADHRRLVPDTVAEPDTAVQATAVPDRTAELAAADAVALDRASAATSTPWVAGAVTIGGVLVLGLAGALWWRRRRRRS